MKLPGRGTGVRTGGKGGSRNGSVRGCAALHCARRGREDGLLGLGKECKTGLCVEDDCNPGPKIRGLDPLIQPLVLKTGLQRDQFLLADRA